MIVSDSMGRPWRDGITDVAIGVAGMTAVTDPRGRDRRLRQRARRHPGGASPTRSPRPPTWSRASSSGVPVAVVRGLALDGKLDDDGLGSRALIRGPADDLFRLGHRRGDGGRPRRTPAGRPSRRPPLHADAVSDHRGAAGPDRGGPRRYGRRSSASWRPGRMRCGARARPGHLTASALVARPDAAAVLLTLHPRVGHVAAARRALRAGRPHCARRRRARGARGERHRRAVLRPGAARTSTCTRSPARSACRPGTSTCGSSPVAPTGRRAGAQRRVAGPALVRLGRPARRRRRRAARD